MSGVEFGGWVLGERLGAGGMGAVFRASRGDQQAAIKVIHPGLAADEQFRKRFRREIEIAGSLSTPHAAAILDFDVDVETPWLACELLDGPTLAGAVASRGALPPDDLQAVAAGMAMGLRDMHTANVVHRDIKPANVILTARGPVLVDFGVAAAADLTTMTLTGHRVGSAGWMSPEQVVGDPVGPATDVFSWAATVAYCATGRHPYGTGAAEALMYRISAGHPDLSSVPPLWFPVLTAALARDPRQRPTAAELVAIAASPDAAMTPMCIRGPDVTQAAAQQPGTFIDPPDHPTAVVPAPAPELQRRGGRGRARSAALMAGLVAVMLAGATLWWTTALGRPDGATTLEDPSLAATSKHDATVDSASEPKAEAGATVSASPHTAVGPQPATPLLATSVNVGDPRALRRVGRLFGKHVQEEIRVDIDWVAHIGSLVGDPNGTFAGFAHCFPTCRVGAIQSVDLTARGLDTSTATTFSGVGANWRTTGIFFVESVTIENGGSYQITLNGTGPTTAESVPESASAATQPAVTSSCDVLEGSSRSYPGQPLTTRTGQTYDADVLLVQDVLNFRRSDHARVPGPCVVEDGLFGPSTAKAVRRLQRLSGLEADGVVGPETWSWLMLTFE